MMDPSYLFTNTPPIASAGDRQAASGPPDLITLSEINARLAEVQNLNTPPLNGFGSGVRVPFSTSVLFTGGTRVRVAPGIENACIFIQNVQLILYPAADPNPGNANTSFLFGIPNDIKYAGGVGLVGNPNPALYRMAWLDVLPYGSPGTVAGATDQNRIGFQREYAPVVLSSGVPLWIASQQFNGIAPATTFILNVDGYYLYLRGG